MAEASFYGALRVIAIVILTYYLIKFLFRLLAPMIFKQVVRKAEQKFHEQQQTMYERQQQQQQHTVTPDKPKDKKKIGEYIDYEELE